MIKSGTRLGDIDRYLSILTYYVQTNNSQGRTDINKDAEDLYAGLLNLVLDSNLRNLNYVKANHPAVDLGDSDKRLCVQITSTNSQEKIQHTLDLFFKYGLNEDYDRLIVLIIGSRKEKYRKFNVGKQFCFDAEDNIWDTVHLGKEIGKLSEQKQKMIAEYLEQRLDVNIHAKGIGIKELINFIFPKQKLPQSVEEAYERGRMYFNRYRRDPADENDIALDRAIENFRVAAKQGHVDAQYMLGRCYFSRKEPDDGLIWLRKAAEQNHVKAQGFLGDLYYKGKAVRRNYSEAVLWYIQAADQGYTQAQYMLGLCYNAGEGVERDPAKAVSWFRKAAVQGDSEAQCTMGLCYLTGDGVKKNYEEAIKWFQMAADNGHWLSINLAWTFRMLSFYRDGE